MTCADCYNLLKLTWADIGEVFGWDCFEFDGTFGQGFKIGPDMKACDRFKPKEPPVTPNSGEK